MCSKMIPWLALMAWTNSRPSAVPFGVTENKELASLLELRKLGSVGGLFVVTDNPKLPHSQALDLSRLTNPERVILSGNLQ